MSALSSAEASAPFLRCRRKGSMARSLILGHHVSSRSNVISGSASPGRRSPYRSASIKMTMKDCHESSRDGAVRISRQCVSMSEDTRSPSRESS